jgi:tRNA nucleotidyltransferase (CCA-adding enzyme)
MSRQINIAGLIKEKLPAENINILNLAGILAASRGMEVYLVGGVIRDLLIEYPPDNDLDLVVVGDAIPIAGLLQEKLDGKLTIYKKYGTATLQLGKRVKLDLITARKETYRTPAAPPVVKPSNLKDDLIRRDFTINALACSLMPGLTGLIVDYQNGLKDIHHKLIRIMHEASFEDDPLRIVRAVRFEQRCNFNLEGNTAVLLKKAIDNQLLKLVNRKRLERELSLVNQEPCADKIWQRLSLLGLKIQWER